MNDTLNIAKALAALADVPKAERDVLDVLHSIPETDLLQIEALAKQVYDLFIRNEGPAWTDLEAGVRGAIVLQVESKLWPKARPFEALLAQVSLDMMEKRRRFLDALLKTGTDQHPMERVLARDRMDTAQRDMDASVRLLELLIDRYQARRNRARIGGQEP